MGSHQLADWTLDALKAEAKRRGLKGFSRMTRGQLLDLLTVGNTLPGSKATGTARKPSEGKAGAPDRPKSPRSTKTKKKTGGLVPSTVARPDDVDTVTSAATKPSDSGPGSEDSGHPDSSDSFGSAAPMSPNALLEFVKEQSELPDGYHRLRAVLIPKNPEWAFFYWDVDRGTAERLAQADGGGAVRIYQDDVPIRTEAVSLPYRRHYVAVPDPGGRIRVELGGLYSGTFVAVLTSNTLVVEPNRASEDLSAQFVVPRWVDSPYEDRQPPASWRRMDPPVTLPGVQGDVPWYQVRNRVS